jgi:hypothetical protein
VRFICSVPSSDHPSVSVLLRPYTVVPTRELLRISHTSTFLLHTPDGRARALQMLNVYLACG